VGGVGLVPTQYCQAPTPVEVELGCDKSKYNGLWFGAQIRQISGFPLYDPKTLHQNIISTKLSVYRNLLLDVQSLMCIQLYTAVYKIMCMHIYRNILPMLSAEPNINNETFFGLHPPQKKHILRLKISLFEGSKYS
jgi:hypothetical protein